MSSNYYLKQGEIKLLKWTTSFFNEFNLIRRGTYTDGSCYFHAIIDAYFIPYRSGMIGERPFYRKEFISKFRERLAHILTHTNEKDKYKRTYYNSISNGQLKDLSSDPLIADIVSIDNMKKELLSNNSVSYIYHEMISDILNKDIFILDAKTEDVYVIDSNIDQYYKNRKSIVLLWIKGHYEIVGISKNGIIDTYFSSNNSFINTIKLRLKTKTKSLKNP